MKHYDVPEDVLKQLLFCVTRQPYGEVANLIKSVEANVKELTVAQQSPVEVTAVDVAASNTGADTQAPATSN